MDFFFLYYVKLIIVLKSLRLSLSLSLSLLCGKVNEFLKGIGLETILKNILWENNKVINFSNSFFLIYISHKGNAKNFFKIVY